jgi:hypothetical protein
MTDAHFLETLVLEIASKPIHSTLARSQAEHAGSLPSHFCLRLRQRVHDEIARATLYWVAGSGKEELVTAGDPFDVLPDRGFDRGAGWEKVPPVADEDEVLGGYGEK